MIDATEHVCPNGRCSPILGDTYVYMDDNHLSRLFVERVLTDVLAGALDA